LRQLQDAGAKLILWTCRGDGERWKLGSAVEYFKLQGIEFWAVNENPDQKNWSSSPKAYCDYYIDNSAFGCPLVYPKDGRRAYVDWSKVGPELLAIVKLRAGTGPILNKKSTKQLKTSREIVEEKQGKELNNGTTSLQNGSN